jgi:hypothetical protein
MDEHRQLQAVVAALLALASAILGVSTLGESLSSHRPPAEIQGPSTAGNGEGVLARLWEDPITAVTAAAREGGGRSDGHRADVLQEAIAKQIEDEDLTVLAVMVDGTPFVEDVEGRLRLRYALTAALIGEGYKPTKRTTIGFVWTDSLTARQDGTAARPFTGWAVFPPMQVLNVLLDPAASFRWDGSPPMPASHDSPGPLLVPYEFWEHGTRPGALHCDDCTTRKKPQVLVLWLAEEELAAAPLRGLEALLGQIIPMSEAAGHKIDVALIGPRSSDTLQAMSRPAQGLRISSEPSAREGSQPATVCATSTTPAGRRQLDLPVGPR